MMLTKAKFSLWVVGIFLLLPVIVNGQRKAGKQSQKKALDIPMTAEHWKFAEGSAEFTKHKNVPAIKIVQGAVISKNLNFSNGTIEFDAEPLDATKSPFVSMYFRCNESGEGEVFYLRVGREENHKRNDAVQYAPLIKGINLWDMLPHYQGPAVLHNNNWNHIKLVISGMQMRAYVNDLSRPALEIPYLEGNLKEGEIALEGLAAFANLVIKPDATEDLSQVNGVDLTNHDANYMHRWLVTQPVPLAYGRELGSKDFPKAEAAWDSIDAERNGLINLTRKYGGVSERQYVWLKTNIKSSAEVLRKIQLGFSDEVWVFVNGRIVYVDKNLYLQGMRKTPNGRCSIENASFQVLLKPGDNELLVGVANDFYGWGIIARFENMEGVDLTE